MKRKENVAKLIENLRVMIQADTGLRNSQKKALQQFLDNPDTPERGIFNLATGIGKTRIMSMLALAHLQSNPNSHVVVGIPNTDLFQQEIDAFHEYRDFQEEQRKKLKLPALNVSKQLDMGVFNKDDKNTSSQIIFTSYQSLEKFSQQVRQKDTGLLLLDEAHHVVSDRRAKAVNSFTDALHYGMTATPWYSPERNVENVLGKVIAKISIRDAIQDKEPALAEYKNVLMVSNLSVDLSDVKKNNLGNYIEREYCDAILHAMRGNSANSGSVENWKEAHHYIAQEVARFYHDYVDEHIGTLNGKKCLINCRSQEEARIQVQELNKLFGHTVARMHTSDECDDQTIIDFKEGNLPIVCQVGKLTEGFDMPNLDMTINYPTASLVREAQGAARCLRLPKLDARTPGILPKKMGLVVDIAFKHPAYDNIVDAIRQNGQVLFQDVDGVGSPVIQHTDTRLQTEELDEKELKQLRNKRSQKNDKRLSFTIVSDIKELQHLTREADKLSEERYIPPKRDGMRTSTKFKEFGIGDTTAKKILGILYNQKQLFDVGKGKFIPMVELVNAGNCACLALHENPRALRKMLELYPHLFRSQNEIQIQLEKKKQTSLIRLGMRTSTKFKDIGLKPERATLILKELFHKKGVFYRKDDVKKEHPIYMVEEVRNSVGRVVLALHEDPMALQKLFELYPTLLRKVQNKDVPIIRPGMRTSWRLREFSSDITIKKILQKLYDKKEIFYKTKDIKKEKPTPMVELVRDANNGIITLALHEDLNAFLKLQQLYPTLFLNKIREGMLTPSGLFSKFGLSNSKALEILKQLYEDKVLFSNLISTKKDIPLPVVEIVRTNNGSVTYALHEAPQALIIFFEHVAKNSKLSTSKQRYSMLVEKLRAASKKGGKAKQPVKAPNPPQTGAKPVAKHRTKSVQNTANRSGTTL